MRRLMLSWLICEFETGLGMGWVCGTGLDWIGVSVGRVV